MRGLVKNSLSKTTNIMLILGIGWYEYLPINADIFLILCSHI